MAVCDHATDGRSDENESRWANCDVFQNLASATGRSQPHGGPERGSARREGCSRRRKTKLAQRVSPPRRALHRGIVAKR